MMIFTLVIVFVITLLLGVPIAVSLFLSCAVPWIIFSDVPWFGLLQRIYVETDSFGLMAIPFFMIAGGFLDKGGVSKRLVDFANALVGWLPGGLAVVTFLACAFFGAISGSSAATVAAIGSIVVPAMLREGYPMDFTLATIAIAGVLGIIVPPSIPMVMYGLSASVSVGEVFMGGFIPGFMLAGGMSIYAVIYGRKNLKNVTKKFSWAELGRSFKSSIWALGMPGIVLGGIYGGVFTPTEAAAVSIVYGLFVGAFIYRELNPKLLYRIMKDAVISSSMVMFIIATAGSLGYVMTREMIPMKIANFIVSISAGEFTFMALVTILLILVGIAIECAPAVVIMTPILVPVLTAYNIDPVAFGVIMIINLGIGLVSPPVGVNLYVAASLGNVPFNVVCNRHLYIYMLFAFGVLIFLMVFPEIIMFLPNMMR